MALSVAKTSNDYLRMLLQLLPPGYAWEWSPISAGRHLLAAWADELARVHTYFCSLATDGILRFLGDVPGWSAPDYERLMVDKFGITAEVTDGLLPFTCESACTDYLLDESIRYVIVFTVDDASAIPQSVYDYLDSYKQSHTHYLFRDRSLSVERVIAIDSMHLGEEEQQTTDGTVVINGMHCESLLYERALPVDRLICHWSFSNAEIQQFADWPQDADGLLQRDSGFWPNPPTNSDSWQ